MFDVIGRLGSIRKAALALGVDHAGVSRHLKELEGWAGVPLMERSRGANGRLTVAGTHYHRRVAAALLEIDDAGSDLLRSCDVTRLDIWCSHGFAGGWLVPRLDRFARAHADIDLALRPTESPPDFASRHCQLDIRFIGDWVSRPVSHGMETQDLFRSPVFPVASPALLATMRSVSSPEDLLRFPLLYAQADTAWRRWLTDQGVRNVDGICGTPLWHASLPVEAAKRGQGLALAHHFVIEDALRAGDLVEVTMGGKPAPRLCVGSYTLRTREELWHSQAIKKFRVWIRNELRRDAAQPPGT